MRVVLALTALLGATAALAGPWIDDKGRTTTMTFPGVTPASYVMNGHSLQDGAKLFDKVCLKTGFDRAAVAKAIDESGWGFSYRAEMMPFNDPVDVGGWNAPDATLRMANGIFFNKKPQCGLAFAPIGLTDMAAVQEVLTELLGKTPDNADKQFDKKGRPKKYYTPEWTLTDAGGAQLKIFAHPLQYNGGAVQIAALKI